MESQIEKKSNGQAVESAGEAAYFEPPADVQETNEALVISFDVPGALAEDVETEVRDSQLTLTAKVRPVDGKWRPLYGEVRAGHFRRQFRLGQQLDQSRITAKLEDGVLTVILPKVEAAKPRRIRIQVN
ncbi:MAG: Hsp20/alpha crystallin family protein [Myxococcales bacterium]|nr:Hsp20/alpha crystallin family protein [Myxococcales bacterium]